ncbi:MAG: S16 family serine protease [Candidatus Micrarchaeota archaeon]
MRFASGVVFFLAATIAFSLGYYSIPSFRHVVFFAPALNEDGKGSMVEFEMFYLKGEGRTLVNIGNADFSDDVENALRKARFFANEHMGVQTGRLDLVLQVNGGGDNRKISGESAGGMFAVGIIALQTGKTFRKNVAISATLNEKGELADVGGIEEKIIAAMETGRGVFLVSSKQQIKDEPELSRGIRIIRVSNLGEAAKYLLE